MAQLRNQVYNPSREPVGPHILHPNRRPLSLHIGLYCVLVELHLTDFCSFISIQIRTKCLEILMHLQLAL